jgi:acyl carrier protein
MTEKFTDVLMSINPMIYEENSTHLIHDGVIDSLDVINIISKLEEEFDIKFSYEDISAENFKSLQSIWLLVKKLTGGE